jgi:NADH:ubiquinone oxidoreductase subunit F (NADH-binding)
MMTQRLSSGWRPGGDAVSLAGHHAIFGPLPGGRRAGSAPPGMAAVTPRGLVDAVAAAGLTGRGGAGFPTATKLAAVASGRGPAVVVVNGMESEPASRKDQALLAMAPHLVLDGAATAARAVGAGAVHLCLDGTRLAQIETVRRAVAERQQAGLDRIPVQVHEVPPGYVASEETALVRWLNTGLARPAVTPPRPAERGVRRKPTLVDNVETLAHLALIARFGPAWFRAAGCADMPGTMLVTVTGAATDPGVYEIDAGTLTGDVLALGGADPGGAVLIGGYFGTWHQVRDVAGLPLTAAGLRRVGGSPGAGVIFALPAGCCGIAETARILAYLAAQSAGQCGPCRFGLPAIAADLGQLAAGQPDSQLMERLARRLGVIPGRGACRHPDGAVRMTASGLRAFAADARAHAAGRPCRDARWRWSAEPARGPRAVRR